MGSCISKCIPKNSSSLQEQDHDHDHVIVHVKHAICPAVSPSPSSASLSSSSSSTATSGYSLSSSSSSCSSKDSSFSNEFLKSCAKENQHLILLKPDRETTYERPNVVQSPNLRPCSVSPRVHVGGSTPKKRARASSPTLVRQKSFRRDPQSVSPSACRGTPWQRSVIPDRALRSPSLSRRFPGDGKGKMENSTFRQGRVFKGNLVNSASSVARKENFKPGSRGCQPRRVDGFSKGNIVNSKIDEEVQSSLQEMDAMLIEDINNPLIALDCFIFL